MRRASAFPNEPTTIGELMKENTMDASKDGAWVRVPREPTLEMQRAGLYAIVKTGARVVHGWAGHDCYRAMLAAAPPPPAQPEAVVTSGVEVTEAMIIAAWRKLHGCVAAMPNEDDTVRIRGALLAALAAPASPSPAEPPPAQGAEAVARVRYCWDVMQGQCSDGDGFTERAAMDLELAIDALERSALALPQPPAAVADAVREACGTLTDEQDHLLMCAVENLRCADRTDNVVDAAWRMAEKIEKWRLDAAAIRARGL